MEGPAGASFLGAHELQRVHSTAWCCDRRPPLVLEAVEIKRRGGDSSQAVDRLLLQLGPGRIIGIEDIPFAIHMHLLRQVHVVVHDLIDALVIVLDEVAIAVIAVVIRALGSLVVEIAQLAVGVVGSIGYLRQLVAIRLVSVG